MGGSRVNSVCSHRVMDCPGGAPALGGVTPGYVMAASGPIHTSFVPESWTGALGGWSLQPPTPLRNLWAKSLPDGSWASAELLQRWRSQHASRQPPSFLESLC